VKNLHRGRLMLSTCLTGIALASASGAQAQTQDKDPTWQPRAEVDARAADGSSQVSFELFAPLAQNDSNLMFVTGRIGTDERYDRSGSVTFGGRGKIGEDVAIGVNAGVDFYKSNVSKRDVTAVSFGLEGFTSVFDVRLNYRLPVTNRSTIGYLDPNASPAGVLSIENNRLIERKSGWRLEDVPLGGANGEVGATVPLGKKLSVRASAAGFDYRDDAASKAYRGVRGGLELGVEDPLGTGGRFSLGAELQNDNRWGTQARGTVRLSIPLGRGSRDRSAGTSGLDRQMGDRIRRDYVSPSGTRYTDLTSTSGTAGAAGTSTATTTLADAVTRAGANGIVVALGNAGNIASSGVTLATNQYLVGGASSVSVRHSDGSVSAFSFGGTNGAIVGNNAGGAAVTLGQGSVVRDVTVRGSGSGILANGVGGFSLERVIIENTGAAGLTLTNTTGAVAIDGITIRGGAGAGVVINGGSSVSLTNSTIGGGAGAIDINDAGGNLTTSLSNLTLSATGGNVLDIDGSGAGTVTVAGLSGINIVGGNGETGGFAARYVTFDSSTAAGIQAVNAGTMQVGTAAARVNGAGVTLTEVDGALTFGTLNVFNNGGTGLTVNNTKTGTFTLTNTTGTVNTTAGTALNLDPLLIDLNFTAVSSVGATGAGVVLSNVQGAGTGGNALTIGTLTVTNSGQQGLYITGGSTGLVTIGGGTITNAGGASVQIGQSGVAGSGGTIGLNFGAAITDAGAGPLVSLFNVGGAIRFTGAISGAGPITINGTTATSSIAFAGNTTIADASGTAISINNLGGSLGFTGTVTITNPTGSGIAITNTLAGSSVTFAGATSITGAASPALSLDNLAGSTTFSGLLTIANPAGTGIVIGTVPGGVTFGDVDITGLGAATGVNLTGTSGNVTFNTLDITGTGAAGSTGIDLTNAANAGAITITNPSVIQGVDIGVNLTNAHITGSFRYGDANAANGLQSRITANTVIVVAGMNATQGTYNFADVQLDGNTNNITGGSFTAYYVLAGASGTGTATNPGSIAGAAASGAQYIVLLNNPTGGQDVIDTAGLAGGALSLTTGQTLVSFLNTDFFAVTGATVPANLILTNLGPTGIVNTYTGSGAAILTSTTGGSTLNLANDTRVDGVIIHNDAAGTGIVGAGVSNVIIRNSTVSGNGGAISLIDGGTAASATLTNLNLSATGGTVLNLSGAGAGTLNVSGTGINIAATGTAQGLVANDVTVGTLTVGAVTTATAGGLAAVQVSQVAGGTVNIGSVTVGGASAGVGLGVSNNSATVNIGAVTATNTAGVGVVVSGNTGNVTLGAVTVANSGSDGLRLTGNSGNVTVGAVTSTNAGGSGIRVSNTTGNVNIASASVTGAADGVEVSNLSGNLTVGATSIANSTGVGILINGVGGTATFGATTIANSAGIVLGAGSTGIIAFGDTDITGLGANQTGVDARSSGGTVSFATLDITGTSTTGTRGIDLTGATFAGSFTVTDSSTITGVGTGVDLTNAAITGTFRYGDGSNTDADGARSTISASTPIAIGGLNQTVGSYNFSDVSLVGDTTNLAINPVTVFFVEQGRTGAGTKTDPGSLAAAAASGANYIVLLNNPTGGQDVLDVLGLGTLTLGANQHLIGFLNSDTQAVGGGTPANLFLYGITPGIVTNPYAGSGAALLTNSGAGATVTLSSGSSIDGVRIGATGIGVSGIGVSNVSITNSIISGGSGAILLRDGGAAASATLTNLALSGTGGTVLNLLGTNGGTLTLSGSGLSIAATGNARGLALDTVTIGSGNLAFTTVSTLTSAGSGVSLANNVGTGGIGFTSINVAGTSSLSGVRVVGNSAAINLGNVTVGGTTGAGSYGIEIGNNPGNVTLGTFDISNTGAGGLLVFGMPGTFTAAGGTVTNSGTMGIGIGDVDGSVTFTGAVTVTNPGTAGIAFNTGSTGTISFADVDILGVVGTSRGVDARLASGNISFATLDITGTGAAGTRGIDLTGATFSGNLIVNGSSTITGVGTGVDLTNAAITGTFRYGDGSNTDANGAGSTINATTPLIVAGMNAITGTYNFADVNLVGDTSSLATSATVYWVVANGTGTGTRSNPGSLQGAAASGADIIILVNNPAGGNDTIDANDPTYGVAGGTLTLLTNQQLRGFLNGDTISLPGGAPANVVLYNIAQGFVTNPFAGSGAPTLTTSAGGGADTVRVTGNNLIDGVRITGAGTGIYGTGAANITIRNSIISGGDSAIELAAGGGAASAALSNLVLTTTGNSIPLALYAVGGGSMTITQLSNITITQGVGSQGAYLDGATFDADLATAGYQTVDASLFLGSASQRLTGNAVNLSNALGALNFTDLAIYNQSGTGILATGAGLTLTSTTGTIDTLNGAALSLTDTSIDLVLASVTHAGTGTGITVTNVTGTGTGGRAMDVANLTITGASNGIAITGATTGSFSFGAASSISGTSGAAIALGTTAGPLDFTYAGSVSVTGASALLDVSGHAAGTVTFTNTSNLSATNGTGLNFSNADGTYAFNGTTTLNGGDAGIDIVGGSAGSFTFGAGTTITNPTGAAINVASSTAGVTYLGTVNQSLGAALNVSAHSGGTLNFSGATFNVSGGDGMSFDNADGTYSFGSATLTGGAQIGITNGSAGTFTFGAGTSVTDAAGAGLFVSNSTANLTYAGSISQSLAALVAVDIGTHSGGTLDFTGATFNITGGTGISFFDADGTYSFGDLALAGGARLAILGGSAGTFTFGNVDITGLAANTTAANLSGATGNVTFATLDITGASTTGTRGIDMTGSTTAGNVIISGSSQITGVGIGVDLTNAAITGNFRYGDGSNTDGNGAASNITAVTPLVIAGLNGGTGVYNFADVNMNGDTTNLSVSAYFVLAGATGTGTRSDPGSLAGAEASGATYIVLLNDPTGGTDVLDATADAGGSLDLAGGQSLYGFRDTDSFTVGGGAPANVLLFNVQTGVISNPFAGSGAPTLTASGANATVVLGGGNTIDGVVIANSGTGAGVLGNGAAAPIIIRNSTISGGAAGAIRIYDNTANVTLALNNLTLAANGGNILNLDGSGTGSFTITQLSNLTVNHTTETGGFAFSNLTFDSDTVTAGTQAVSAGNLTLGTPGSRITGDGLSLIDVFGTLNFGDLNIANNGGTGLIVINSKANNFSFGTTGGAIDTTNGTAINLDPLTVNMVLGSVNSTGGLFGILLDQVDGSFTVTGAVNVTGATNTAIVIQNNTGQADAMDAHFQGAVTINNTTGAGISLTNNAGATVDFTGGLGITTTTGRGFFATGGGTLSVTGTGNTITTGNATALALGTVTVANAGVSFSNITAAPAAVQAVLASGTALNGALDIGGLNIGGGSTGVLLQSLSGTGGVNFTGTLDLDTTGVGFQLNGAVGTVNIANVAGSTLTIDGASTGISLNGMTGGTVNVGNNGGLASIGATTSSTAAAIGITGSSGGTLNYGGTIDASAGSVLSVSSSSVLATLSGTIDSTTAGTAFSFSGAGGIYTISGEVSHSGGAGVSINATSTGNVSFLNASKTFSTGANTAISMAGTGTLSLLGGGLGITTTSGTGFSATAGTVSVLGAGNTINTATGQILGLSGVTSGSGGITFDSLTATGTVANNGILLSGLSGAAFNGGTVNIGGTSGAANDGIKVATGTAAITFGDTTIGTAGSNAIELLNSNSAVTFGVMNLSGANGSTVVIAGSTGAVTLGTGTITATGAANYAVSLTGGTGDVTIGSALGGTNMVQIVDHEIGTVTFSGNMASTVGGISVTNVNSGLITFTGQTLALNATAFGVTLAGNSGGTIDFNPASGGGLTIISSGSGFSAGSGGTVVVRGTGNSISTTGTGTALSLQNVTIGTNGFNFNSVSANGATTGILLNGLGTTAPALSLGTVNLQGITSRGIDVTGILSAGLSITDLDIGLASNSAVALDLNGATLSAPIIVGDFDVTNSGGAGTSIGVDLRGTLGGASILLGGQLTASSSISGVGTGIYLDANTNALLTYGDGESGTDIDSTISATTAINASAAPTLGTYDFRDVAFSGSPGSGFGLNKIYFVDSDGSTGGGDGSGSDGFNPMTLAAAELAAVTEDIIVLVNNGNPITAAGSNGNDSLVLASNVQVRGFGNGAGGGAGSGSAPIVIALTVPSTILLSGGGSVSIADPTVTGGAATLTSAAGANAITLGAAGNHLSGFILDGGGAVSRGIKDNGAGATNTLLDYLTVRNFGTMGIEITPSTGTTIDHVAFSGNPGGDVLLNAANSVLTNIVSNGGGITLNNATGTTTLTNVNLTGGAGLTFTNAAGTINATNVDITNPLAAGLTISGGTAAFNFDSTSSVSKSSAGAALSIGGGHATGTFTYAGTLNITGGTGLQFDNADGTYNFTGNTTLAGGDAGIDILNGSGGSFVFGTNTTITSPTGTAFNVSGSTAAITYSGNITQANNAALVSFLNHSGGTVTFQTGTLSATNGTGLQFDNADATYAFNGTTTLNGGDAGVDILNGSGGTFTFASGASITSPTGTAFNVSGSTAAVTYNGSITQANNAALVNVLNHSGGTLTFQGGTLSATNGTGLQFNNADGTYNFTGTTTLNGGDAGIDIVNGSDGTFGFGANTAITHAAAGDAFVLTDSNSNLTYSGVVSDANGYAVRIDNHDTGTVTFDGGSVILSSGANALGLSVTNSNGGSVSFNGNTTLSTQANNAVTLSANAGSTVAFSSVGTALGITTTSGTAFVISGGGTINATGPNSTITTGSGTIFDISNAAAVTSTLNLNFASASNTLGANGILVSRTAGTLTGSVTVNAGSITATTRGIDVDGGTLSLNYAGSVATSGTTARSVEVTNITSGAIVVSGNLTDNALGINIANNTGGSINFYGQSITLNTVANVNAVTLASNTGANITFSSAAGGNGVDITASGTGNGIDFTGGGTLTVYSTGNSIQTATGQILNLVNGNVGSLGLVFDSLTSTGSTNGSAININNVDGTGTLSATTVSIAGTTGATADGIFYGGGSTMNVNLGAVTIANTGDEGIEINGTGNGTFTAGSVTINNTAGNGVEINNSNNTVSLNGGAIGATNDPSGFGVYILNGTGAVTIGSSITKTSGNNVVFVDNHETGNVAFSGAISATGGVNNGIVVQNVNSGTIGFLGNTTLSTGVNTAVNLLNNTGGTITFPNGGLAITTTSGTGFSATGGGTVTTAGSGNTISSGAGTALNVVNTTIGSGGLRFQSISSNGASSGIILNNTGSSGGINVTGTGAAGSGGTIQNSSGDGISLTSTENVRLAYMNVTNNLGDGIGGSNINGFLIDNMLISGNGNDTGTDESGINITELTGTASNGARPTGIFNSTIQNNYEFEVQITNSTGTLTNFQVVNSTFSYTGANAASSHGNLINFLGTGTSSMGISVSGSNFTGNWNAASPPTLVTGSGLFADSSGTSMTVQVSGSTFTNNNNGINVSTGPGSTTLTYNIDNNNFVGTRSTAINDFQNGNAPFTRTVNGRITNNIIGNNAVTNSGSNVGAGISISNEGGVNANYLISGNTIQQIQTSQGIVVNVGLVGQATGNLTTNVTILNNTIRNINGSRGLVINNNQNTGGFPTVNVSVSGNSFSGIAGQAGNGQYLRLSASGGGTINVTQGQATASAIATELDDANGFNDTTKISIGTGTFNYGQPAPTQPPASVPLP
jgi:mucin-19